MARATIGIIANEHMLHGIYEGQATTQMNLTAVADVCGAMPLIIPAIGDKICIERLMSSCDGFLLTGGRPNVHPDEYGEVETAAHGDFDRARDALVLPLIRACVAAGQPIFGICRGFQEINVAMGGSLHAEVRDLPGRDNHRMPPEGTVDEKFALRHTVTFTKGGVFERLLGSQEVMTNTLHGQAIKQAGQNVVIDGVAPDGTAEALYLENAKGFSLGVQWHPEYRAALDPVSKPLFEAFGAACAKWSEGARPAPVFSIAGE